jgi:flagellar motor switch protein FliN/FliY
MFTNGSPCFGRGGAFKRGGVSTLDDLTVELTVVLGRNRMPIHMLLRMGRGAIIELAATETDMVEILANDHPVARGQVVVTGTRIAVEVTEILKKPRVARAPGSRVGDASLAAAAAAEV